MDRRNRNGKGGRRTIGRSLALAVAGAAGSLVGTAHHAHASVIDVVLSRSADGNTSVPVINTPNNGVTPLTYTPGTVSIPVAPGQTYDAADTADTGTNWNTLLVPGPSVNNTSGSSTTTLYQQNLPLVDSLGNSTTALLSISFTENNGKNDTVHSTGMCNGTNPGSDGLLANPALPNSAAPPNGPGQLQGLMSQSWLDNGTSEFINFNMSGLTPGHQYLLYVYGAGANVGNGGSYTVGAAGTVNAAYEGTGFNATAFAYSTEPNATQIYRSVFDNTGINPIPEKGLTWTVLPVVTDASGDLQWFVNKDNATGSKGYINGFQLDDLTPVPEPASIGVLAAGSLALMLRKRRRST
jgi:hypothetical protein